MAHFSAAVRPHEAHACADELSHLFALLPTIAAFAASAREAIATAGVIRDPVTADILTEVTGGLAPFPKTYRCKILMEYTNGIY